MSWSKTSHQNVYRWIILTVLVIILDLNDNILVAGHGMMWDPPARSTMWRLGFNTPINYDDNALNCGGRGVIL